MELNQSLGANGEYLALHGEVVTYDVYRMRDVADIVSINDPKHVHVPGHARGFSFTPDTILDLGGNVGVFSRYARELFPEARIIAVEPNPDNCAVFREHTQGVTLIESAIGRGNVYRSAGANGAMEVYLSEGLGFTEIKLGEMLELTKVPAVMLTDLKQYITGKVLLKLDIEGNETVIFNDPASMDLLRTFDYICMELHYYASDGQTNIAVRDKTAEALESLKLTHNTFFDHIYFYATKR